MKRHLAIHFWASLLILLYSSQEITAQTTDCQTTVDAGEDIELCHPIGVIDLIGDISTDPSQEIYDFIWEGPNIDDPTSLVTTANPGGSATYTLTARIRQENLIVNGGFEQGNSGFYSDYSMPTPPYSQWGPLGPEGTYMISNNPASTHTNFAPCSDHTSGNGNMMVVNGDPLPNARVWCQTITVDPDADYEFSTWGTSVNSSNPARLQFSIDGAQLGSVFSLSPTTCHWQEFFEEWTSEEGGMPYDIEICIINQNTQTSGNDFALDDIFFGRVCKIKDEKQVIEIEDAEYTLDTLLCYGESLEIHGETYSTPGLHGPITLQSEAGCDSFLSVNINYIDLVPIVINNHILTCDRETITISAENSIIHPSEIDIENIVFFWETTEGNILSGQGTAGITVDAPGIYYLSILYQGDDIVCTSEVIAFEVYQLIDTPDVDIIVVQEDCNSAIWELTAFSSDNNIEYIWSTIGGNIPGSHINPSILALQEGIYIVEARNTMTGCKGHAEVRLDMEQLLIDITGNLTIDCINTETILYGVSTSGYNFTWSTENGNIQGNTSEDSIIVDKEGIYQLKIFMDDCIDSMQVEVNSLIEEIEISLPDRDTITCSALELIIIADISGPEDYSVNWYGSGNIHDPHNKDTIIINSVGTYYIEVTTEGACTALDSIIIISDDQLPEFSLHSSDTLNCIASKASISVIQEPALPDLIYTWTSTDGKIDSIREDAREIIVSEAGYYILEVLDSLSGCSYIDSIKISADYSMLNLDAGITDTLTCQLESIQLSASVDSIEMVGEILWTTQDGNISSGINSLNPTITAPGLYYITARHLQSYCISIDSVRIEIDDAKPIITSSNPLELNCKNPTLLIDKSGSTHSPTIHHSWEIEDGGNIIAGEDSYIVTIDAPGTYIFSLTDLSSSCTSSDTISVSSNFESPSVRMPTPDIITCAQSTVIIQPEELEDSYTYTWSTDDGKIISGSASANVEVNSGGTYLLDITDEENGCKDSFNIFIDTDTISPVITVKDTLYLDCNHYEITINAEIESVENHEITWKSASGQIHENTEENTIVVDEPGRYTITVLNLDNGCQSYATIEVISLIQTPTLKTGPDITLTCERPSGKVFISEVEEKVEITWLNESGQHISHNTDTISVNTPGTYYVQIIDVNSCSNLDSIIVIEDKEIGQVSAGDDIFIGCGRESMDIVADIHNVSDYNFLWLNETGDTVSSSQGYRVSEEGVYRLIATHQRNGCKSDDVIEVFQTDSIAVNYEVTQGLCRGDIGSIQVNTIIGGLPDFSISIDGKVINLREPIDIRPGEHQLKIRDALGCEVDEVFNLEDAKELTLQYPSSIDIAYGDSAQLIPLVIPIQVKSKKSSGFQAAT